ncbi:MAG TPA: hypothetical protein PK745_10895, partial [bacterium]|nr:hypothetical protein [bacterium]
PRRQEISGNFSAFLLVVDVFKRNGGFIPNRNHRIRLVSRIAAGEIVFSFEAARRILFAFFCRRRFFLGSALYLYEQFRRRG